MGGNTLGMGSVPKHHWGCDGSKAGRAAGKLELFLPRKSILGPLAVIPCRLGLVEVQWVQQLLLSRGRVGALEEAEGSRSKEINRDQSLLMAWLGLQGCGFACRQGRANLCKVLSNGNVPLHFLWQRFSFANQEFQTEFEIGYLDQTIPMLL